VVVLHVHNLLEKNGRKNMNVRLFVIGYQIIEEDSDVRMHQIAVETLIHDQVLNRFATESIRFRSQHRAAFI
jgi:hypothetical protein